MKKILVVHRDKPNKKDKKLVQHSNLKIEHVWKNTLNNEQTKGVDIVIAIGGDGTIMSASHFLKKIPILGVNSEPDRSVGALATITIDELPKKIEDIAEDNFKTELLERIRIKINNKKIEPLCLNEVFVANEKAYLVSNYKITHKAKTEKQKSSGIIVSTGTGSTAWFKSAGGNPFSPQSKYVKMVVREPYFGHHKKKFDYSLLKTKIKEGENITIEVNTPSVLSIDSIREFHLNHKDKIVIDISPFPLQRII